MKKWLLGLLLGGFLGIVIGSVGKGLIAGVLIGFFSQKFQSLALGIIFGVAVGALLAFGVALMQYYGQGRVYFWQIMLPGAVVGLILGYVTQRHGRRV